MNPVLSLAIWVSLPNETRLRLRELFNIPRSSNSDVIDGRIVSDGITHDDLTHLTIGKMQQYISSDSTDFHKLFDIVLAHVNDEMQNPGGQTIVASSDVPLTVIIEPKKRGRPSKK